VSSNEPTSNGSTWHDTGADGLEAEVRRVQPYQAVKAYLCPGCGREISTGTGHLVVVPVEAADLRRHWHRGCWVARGVRPARA
jgi:hypothetical protein